MTTATDAPALSTDLSLGQMCECHDPYGNHKNGGRCRVASCQCQQFVRIYSSADVVALTGATYRQINYWTRCGLIDDNRGAAAFRQSGRPLWFTAYQLDVVNLAVALVKWGLVPSRAFEEARRAVQTDESRAVLPNTAWQVQIVLVTVQITDPEPPTEGTTQS